MLDYNELYISLTRTAYAFSLLFTYCEMGERMSGNFAAIEDEMKQMDWHLFPIKTQRMMIILLTATQQPVKLKGFGNLPATRITMKQVKILSIFFRKHYN